LNAHFCANLVVLNFDLNQLSLISPSSDRLFMVYVPSCSKLDFYPGFYWWTVAVVRPHCRFLGLIFV